MLAPTGLLMEGDYIQSPGQFACRAQRSVPEQQV